MSLLSKNVGSTDKTIHVVVGSILVGIGLYIGNGTVAWAVGLVVAVAVMLVTAFTSTYPMYMPFGINARRLRKRS
ncbi:MAG: DUF2892 domain-containing protein [Spirosoma sp.]|nr:DUF2892 domain-containing protein [Spirosoma sp.]